MNNTADLISFIVTNFNHAAYLDQRMESLLRQTYPNFEIIVVDDCSTDGSQQVLAKYQNDPRIKVVLLEKNGGYPNATNLGVSLSKGQFIMFAESDDYDAPTHIELLHKAMVEHKQVGVAYCRSFLVDSEGKTFGEDFDHRPAAFKKFCSQDTVIPKHTIQRFFLLSCVIPNMSAALIRKEYFYVAGGFSTAYKVCADWDFWCRMSRCCDFYYLTQPLSYFRTHAVTVRSKYSLQFQLTEIMDLLYKAARATDLSVWERINFRINMGVLWGRYRKPDPAGWWKSFAAIWRESLKFDKLSLLFLIIAFLKRTIERIVERKAGT